MAVVLDINMLCNEILDLNMIATLLNKYSICMESMNVIDSWMWDNEKKVEDLNQIASILDMQHIVIIKLKSPQIKDMGVYIEKFENQYLYTLWINTEGYPMLDCEKITKDNCEYYKEIVRAILELNGLIKDFFDLVGIGLETDICYEKNVMDIVQNSKNVMIWILSKHKELNIQLDDFKSVMVEGVHVLQRK